MESAIRVVEREVGHCLQAIESPSNLASYFSNQSAQLLPALKE